MTKNFFKFFSSRFFLTISLVFFFVATIFLTLCTAHYKEKLQQQVHISINEELFQQKISQPPPRWMITQIEKDLAPFAKSKITSEMIEHFFRGDRIARYHLARFTIQNGHLSYSIDDQNIDSRQFRHTLAAIRKLNEITSLPDVDFVISIEDGYDRNPGFPHCPCLTFSKGRDVAPFVLMPDFKALTGYPSLREEILKAKQKYPWEQKNPKCFWRGASTGGFLTSSNWTSYPRCQLVILSSQFPQIIDARFATLVQCTPETAAFIKSQGLLSARVAQGDHLKYKYLIDVDGNACTFERLFWLLLSNSVTFKQNSSNIQWYYEGLEPYRHYIPVKTDLSDLLHQIEWARQHDSEARAIADRAQEFVKNNLSIEDVYLYLYHLFNRYASLQKTSE